MKRVILGLVIIISSCGTRESAQHQHGDQAKGSTSPKERSPRPTDLMLTESQKKLGNITTARVGQKSIGQSTLITGKIVFDQEQSQVISSSVPGRIAKLFIKEGGGRIKKGEPLYEIYSETLLTLQKEFLLAKEQANLLGTQQVRYRSFLDASRRKLVQLGMTESQVKSLGDSKVPRQTVTFLSPIGGTVRKVNVTEGQYVAEGEALISVDDLSTLWVEAELYPSESALPRIGETVTVTVVGNELKGTISFLSPEFKAGSQIVVMRVAILNTSSDLLPGMYASVALTHSSHTALTVPVGAVIRDEHGQHVYVQRGHNTFRSQMVKTGIENFSNVEITDGLVEGDTIAVTGAYLLYSDFILKNGSDPMAGHNH